MAIHQHSQYILNYNLYLKSTETGKEYQLSNKGEKYFEYASYVGWADIMEGENGDRPEKFYVNWSPDSKYLQANICDLRYADKMYLLDLSNSFNSFTNLEVKYGNY